MARGERTPAMVVDLATRPRLAWWLLPHAMWPAGIGYFGFFHNCPAGHQNFYGFDMDQVRVQGAQRNVVVNCPVCRTEFDIAPGDSVEVSTLGGRVTVRQIVTALKDLRIAVKEASPHEISRLTEALREGRPADELRYIDGPIARWAARYPQASAVAVGTLAGALGTLVAMWAAPRLGLSDPTTVIEKQVNVTVVVDHDPDDGELERIVREATRGASGVVDDTKGPIRRR